MHHKAIWQLAKKANRGFRGYPLVTVAFYGPDDRHASKAVAGLVPSEGVELTDVERWFAHEEDARDDLEIAGGLAQFVERHGAKTVVLADRIIGCPHEEGVDYPEGQKCLRCPFWANRDRWSGNVLQ
jgi:hypothetical protein